MTTIVAIAGAATAATISNIASGVTVQLSDDDLENVSLDYAADVTANIEVGAAAGAIDLGTTFTLTDAQTVNLTTRSTATGDITIGAVTLDAVDTDYVNITATVEDAGLTFDSTFGATLAKTVSLTTSEADSHISVAGTFLTSASVLTTLTVSAAGDDDSDITIVGILGGTAAAAALTTISVTAADAADATLGTITATGASITSITATASTTGSVITFGDITATSLASLTASAVTGATFDSAGNLDIGSIGTITLSGAGTFVIDGTDSDITTLDTLDASSTTGTVTIVLDDLLGASTITLGSGTNALTVGQSSDAIILESEDGADTITQNATSSGSITITNFEVDGSDIIELSEAGMNAGGGVITLIDSDADGAAVDGDVVFATLTAALDLDTITADNNVLVLDGDIDDATDLETQLAIGGDFALTLGAEFGDDEGFLVLWDDGINSYLSAVVNTSGAAIADGDTLTTAELSVVTFVTLVGVTDATDITVAMLGTALNA
jgi:hypothetical protein